MKAKTLIAMLFVSFFVLISEFANADEVSKIKIQRTTTIQYELLGPVLSPELQQGLESSIVSTLNKGKVPGVVVSVGESSVTLYVKESSGFFSVHNFFVLRSIFEVLGKEPEILH